MADGTKVQAVSMASPLHVIAAGSMKSEQLTSLSSVPQPIPQNTKTVQNSPTKTQNKEVQLSSPSSMQLSPTKTLESPPKTQFPEPKPLPSISTQNNKASEVSSLPKSIPSVGTQNSKATKVSSVPKPLADVGTQNTKADEISSAPATIAAQPTQNAKPISVDPSADAKSTTSASSDNTKTVASPSPMATYNAYVDSLIDEVGDLGHAMLGLTYTGYAVKNGLQQKMGYAKPRVVTEEYPINLNVRDPDGNLNRAADAVSELFSCVYNSTRSNSEYLSVMYNTTVSHREKIRHLSTINEGLRNRAGWLETNFTFMTEVMTQMQHTIKANRELVVELLEENRKLRDKQDNLNQSILNKEWKQFGYIFILMIVLVLGFFFMRWLLRGATRYCKSRRSTREEKGVDDRTSLMSGRNTKNGHHRSSRERIAPPPGSRPAGAFPNP